MKGCCVDSQSRKGSEHAGHTEWVANNCESGSRLDSGRSS